MHILKLFSTKKSRVRKSIAFKDLIDNLKNRFKNVIKAPV